MPCLFSLRHILPVFLWLTLSTLPAQVGNQLHFENISGRQGLSFPTVTCLLQDARGFMWIGTTDGLNKYDSRQFTRFFAGRGDSTQLLNSHILNLYEDQHGRIWVGTDSGLSVYDPATAQFRSLPEPALRESPIVGLTGDRKGTVWAVTRRGIHQIDDAAGTVLSFPLATIGAHEPIKELNAAAYDGDGRLWINTDRGLRQADLAGARLLNPLQDHAHHKDGILEFYSSIYLDSRNRIWVSDRGAGLRYYSPADGRWQRVANLSSNYINGVAEDFHGRLWICTGRNGLNILDPATLEVEVIKYADQPENNFVSNSLSAIYADNMGGIWIGTFNNGVQYHYQHQLKYTLYFPKGEISGLNSNYITALTATAENDLWIGAGEEGLFYFNRDRQVFRKLTPHGSDPAGLGELKENFYIMSLLLTEDGRHLIIGTLTGFYDYEIATDRWTYFHGAELDTQTVPNSVNVCLVQRGNQVFVAGKGGIQVYDLETRGLEAYPLVDRDALAVFVLFRDSTAYVASNSTGLFRLDETAGELVREDFAEDAGAGIALAFEDSRGRYLISQSGSDLRRYNRKLTEFEVLSKVPPGQSMVALAICEGRNGTYWVATNQGLALVDSTFTLRHLFDQNEGFQPTYFVRSALTYTQHGEVLVGGNTGLYAFDPDDFQPYQSPSTQIHLTDFLLSNRSAVDSTVGGFRVRGELSAIRSLDLPTYQHLITFEYTALDYHNPARVSYAYRLEPYEQEWNSVGNRNYATYRDLPAGDYVFRVKYRLGEGEFAQDMASLAVSLPPKPWLSVWAWLAYGLIVFFIARHFYLFRRNRRQLRQEVEMQRFRHEKVQELHDFKIEFFTQMTHELRTPLTLMLGPLEEMINRGQLAGESRLLGIIHRNTQKLLRRVNQILDFRKLDHSEMKVFAKKGNIVSYAEEILYSFLNLAQEKGIELYFETNMEKYPYVLFDRDIMEKILTNLISNAIKFTDHGSVTVEVNEPDDQVNSTHYAIRVADTGRGIAADNLEQIFTAFFQEKRDDRTVGSGLGLKMVKQLTELHRGTVSLASAVDSGTSFRLLFPKADLDLMAEEEETSTSAPGRPAALARAASAEPAGVSEGSGTLLVIDDEADVRELIQEMFTSRHRVIVAPTGERGLEVARTEMPDLIICDVMMPGMDGYAFCAAAKADFLLGHIPVVLLTALSSTGHEIEGLRKGADAYVTKPFSTNLLRATVQNLLQSRRHLKQSLLNSTLVEGEQVSLNNADQEFIDRVIALVDRRLDDSTLEVAAVADDLGMSPSTLYRKLKSLTDLSGNEFIRTVRLKRSLAYLKGTDLNISEVAYRVGFSDPKYFSTCFKRLFNVTPSEFQVRQRVDNLT